MRREGKQERRNDLVRSQSSLPFVVTPRFQVDLMMDSIKQDLKMEEDEKQEEQYEKDMKLQVAAKSNKHR